MGTRISCELRNEYKNSDDRVFSADCISASDITILRKIFSLGISEIKAVSSKGESIFKYLGANGKPKE